MLNQGRDVQIGALRGARIRFKELTQMMDVVADLIRDREDPEKYIPKWQERVAEEAAHLDSLSQNATQDPQAASDPQRKEASRGYSVDVAGMRDELLAKQQETLRTKPKPGPSTLGKAYDLVHGAVGAVAGIFIEAGKEAVDLIQINIHFVTLGKYTPRFISEMAAAAEKGASTGDLLKGMITNALETPSRFLQACRDGDWDAIGRETANLYLLADTLKGIPEAVKKFPEAIDKVRELGDKLPELIAKTHESLRILRARTVALALRAEGRLVPEIPKAPVRVEPPKVPAAPSRPAAPMHLTPPPTPTSPPAPAPPVRVVPNPPDMVKTPSTPPKGTLGSVGTDGSFGPSKGAGRQPPPAPPAKTPVHQGQVVANENIQTQQVRKTGTGGAGDVAPAQNIENVPGAPGQGGAADPIRMGKKNTPGGQTGTPPGSQKGTPPTTPKNQEPTRIKPDPVTARPKGRPSTHDTDILSQRGMQRRTAYPGAHQHHVFPQELKAWFKERFAGIDDIDEYTAYLSEGEHQAIHKSGEGGSVRGVKEPDLKGWNQEWKDFMAANRNTATPQQIFEEAGRLMDKYGISAAKIARYREGK